MLPKIHSIHCRRQPNCARVETRRKQAPLLYSIEEDKEDHLRRDIVCSVLIDVQWGCFCDRRRPRRCGCWCQCRTTERVPCCWLAGGRTNDWNLRKFTNSIASLLVALFRFCQHSIYSSHPIWTFSKKCKYHHPALRYPHPYFVAFRECLSVWRILSET